MFKIIGHDQKILEPSEEIDEDAVKSIYMGDESILDKSSEGILDIIQTRAELDADRIRADDALTEKVKGLPLGIRSAVVGSGGGGGSRLLVACEADERLRLDEKIIDTKPFRRYYEVRDGTITKVTASSFLKIIGSNTEKVTEDPDSAYDDALGSTWNRFTRDMKNEQARKRTVKLQTYFEKRLAKAVNHAALERRAKKLVPSINKMIVTNRQPYRSLNDLRKRINTDNLDDESVITELEQIFQKPYTYRKDIGRPRILYSMKIN